MSSGAVVQSGRPGFSPRTGQLMVIGVLLALAVVAWVVTDLRMAGMDAGPGSDPGAFGFYISTWVVMMAAMMFPSIAPMVVMFRGVSRRRSAGATALFVSGYLLVWGLSGLLGYAVLKLGRSALGDVFAWDHAGRWTAAGVLLVAAAYEFTPLKTACLNRCRSPLGFVVGNWREGRLGALRMGAEHGGWCLGCCWALMAALFALGAMSMVWMILIAVLIAAEKLLPWRYVSVGSVAAVLVALAVGVAAAPERVPGLTVPGSKGAMNGSMSGPMRAGHGAMRGGAAMP